jgi:hypothetical protein
MNLISVVISTKETKQYRDGRIQVITTDDHYYCTISHLIESVKKKQGVVGVNVRVDTCGSNFLLDTSQDYTKFIKMVSLGKMAIFINPNESLVQNCTNAIITHNMGGYIVEPMGKPQFVTHGNLILDAMRLATQIKKQLGR